MSRSDFPRTQAGSTAAVESDPDDPILCQDATKNPSCTDTYVANHLKVSRQTVNAIETGKFDPALPLAFRISRLFDLKIEDVFDPGN